MDNQNVLMFLWLLPGYEAFRQISQHHLRNKHGIILSFSYDNRLSFQSLEDRLEDIMVHAPKYAVIVLVANKCDLSRREVEKSEGEAFADEHDLPFFECSAKDNIGIMPICKVES